MTAIRKKIQRLECLDNVVAYINDRKTWLAELGNDGELVPPTEEYSRAQFEAYDEILKHLEKLI